MKRDEGYLPSGPLDPVASQVADFFREGPLASAFASGSVAQVREALKAAAVHHNLRPVRHIEDYRIPVSGGAIDARLYRPVSEPPALIVWAHGGGFVLGSVQESDSFVRELAARSGCAILSVDYRLAPEHKFPTQINDVLEATLWAAARRVSLAGNNVPLILGGDSAGANLTTVATRKLHEGKTCAIVANVLAYPCTDAYGAASLARFEPPFLGVKDIAWFFDHYLPNEASRSHPDFAPLHASNLALLPPTFLLTAEHDIITEQSEAYGNKLKAVGVDVCMRRYPGMIHGFLTIDVFFPGAAGRVMDEVSDFIAGILKRGASCSGR
jgi:acetyl esterase